MWNILKKGNFKIRTKSKNDRTLTNHRICTLPHRQGTKTASHCQNITRTKTNHWYSINASHCQNITRTQTNHWYSINACHCQNITRIKMQVIVRTLPEHRRTVWGERSKPPCTDGQGWYHIHWRNLQQAEKQIKYFFDPFGFFDHFGFSEPVSVSRYCFWCDLSGVAIHVFWIESLEQWFPTFFLLRNTFDPKNCHGTLQA